jgi:hypothetical protein
MEKYNQAIRQLQEAEAEVTKAKQMLRDMILPRLKSLCENFPDAFGYRFEAASDGMLREITAVHEARSVAVGISTVKVVSFVFEYEDWVGDLDYAFFDVPLPYLRDDWEITLAKDLATRNEILDAENVKVKAEEEADERRLFERLQQKYGNKVAVSPVPNVVPLFPENASIHTHGETEIKDADLYRQILDSVAHIPT